jgi:PIN domain nuclease of toxin-antitoxin system
MLVWCLENSKRLPAKARQHIENRRNTVLVSAASIWELAIKRVLKDSNIEVSELADSIASAGFESLNVTPQHATAVLDLPLYHRDPFDRMLVAQAVVETAYLLSHDRALVAYGKVVMLV